MRTAVLASLVCGLSIVAPDRAGAQQVSTIEDISIAPRDNQLVVTITISGSAVDPSVGTAVAPPRIYLDFRNVRPSVSAATKSLDSRALQVRTGLHSTSPLTTRVVVDMRVMLPYRVERVGNQIRVWIGATAKTPDFTASGAIPPVPSLPPAGPTPSAPAPSTDTGSSNRMSSATAPAVANTVPPTSVPALPAASASKPVASTRAEKPRGSALARSLSPAALKDLDKYLGQVSSVLERLRMQQPLLASIDAKQEQTADRMQIAVQEFERLRQELTAIKPPETLRTQHDMLVQSATLALMATQLCLQSIGTNDASTVSNATSAAAGAILLLNRACVDLACQDVAR